MGALEHGWFRGFRELRKVRGPAAACPGRIATLLRLDPRLETVQHAHSHDVDGGDEYGDVRDGEPPGVGVSAHSDGQPAAVSHWCESEGPRPVDTGTQPLLRERG